MSRITPALAGLGLLLLLMTGVWAASLSRRDASLVDRFWGAGFVLLAWLYFAWPDSAGRDHWILPVLVSIWGLRLSLYLAHRNWGRGEDPRYATMRARDPDGFPRRSLVTVFLLQGLLIWILAFPILAFTRRPGVPNAGLIGAGVVCWVIGMVFEAGGDWQLARHRADPARRGTVLATGLWRYTRHPNYFGDAMVWWGYWLMAASVGGWWTVFSPVAMTVLLVWISGVPLLESSLRTTRQGYDEYVTRTSAFFPWFPRRRRGR